MEIERRAARRLACGAAITSGNAPDATDDAVQANIVAAGYGR
jgi:hypothetical protein